MGAKFHPGILASFLHINSVSRLFSDNSNLVFRADPWSYSLAFHPKGSVNIHILCYKWLDIEEKSCIPRFVKYFSSATKSHKSKVGDNFLPCVQRDKRVANNFFHIYTGVHGIETLHFQVMKGINIYHTYIFHGSLLIKHSYIYKEVL